MDAEIEPSANLWAKIEDQLEPKRKRVFPIYWMAAASVAVVFTAMLVFQKTEKIQLHPDDTAVTSAKSAAQSIPSTMEEQATTITQSEVVSENDFVSNKLNANNMKIVKHAISESNLKNTEEPMQPNTITARLLIKQADPRPIDVLPIIDTSVENPIVIANNVADQPKTENDVINEMDNTTERKGIRNVGDLVNYVVDKVDKRDKKLLRFNTDDDDNSSIVGINIGFLKLNKKKH